MDVEIDKEIIDILYKENGDSYNMHKASEECQELGLVLNQFLLKPNKVHTQEIIDEIFRFEELNPEYFAAYFVSGCALETIGKIDDAVGTGSCSRVMDTFTPIPITIPSAYVSQSIPPTFPSSLKISFGHFV